MHTASIKDPITKRTLELRAGTNTDLVHLIRQEKLTQRKAIFEQSLLVFIGFCVYMLALVVLIGTQVSVLTFILVNFVIFASLILLPIRINAVKKLYFAFVCGWRWADQLHLRLAGDALINSTEE